MTTLGFRTLLAITALLAGALAVVGIQHRELVRLRAENQQLQAQAVQAPAAQAEPAQASGTSDELEQLRKDNAELLRLRNEVHQLRQAKAELDRSHQAELDKLRNESARNEQALKALQQQRATIVQFADDGTRISTGTGRVWSIVPPGTEALPKANAWLGLMFAARPDASDPSVSRIVVQTVSPNSPAADAQLEAGDIIVRADGETLTNLVHFRNKVATSTPGQPLLLDVVHEGVPRQVTVVPKAPP